MITIYSKPDCEFCIQAKHLLTTKGIKYKEKVLGIDFVRSQIVEQFPDRKTYPIIVNDGVMIGGYSELLTEINNGTTFGKVLLQE
jgi:glutaredoxin 3